MATEEAEGVVEFANNGVFFTYGLALPGRRDHR